MEISLSLLPPPLQDSKEEPEIYGAIIPHVRVSDWPRSLLPQPGTFSPGRGQQWEAGGTSIWCHSCHLKRQHQNSPDQSPHCSTAGSSRSPWEPWPPWAPRPPWPTRSPLPQCKASTDVHTPVPEHTHVSVHSQSPPKPACLCFQRVHPVHAQPPCKQPVSHGFTIPKSVPVPSLCTRKGVPLPVPSSRHRLCLPSQASAERSWPSGKGISQELWGFQPPWRHLGSALGTGTVTAQVPGTVGP